MAVYFLDDEIRFPHPSLADKDGLLAIGGDLSPERVLLAYTHGIFPWYNEGEPKLWWSPNPRMILIPREFKRSKSLLQTLRNANMEVRFDHDFHSVISNCAIAGARKQHGTWITREMISAYDILHKMGYAHSVETYQEGKIVGGLYGISLGKAFFGESMFYNIRDASKVALLSLVDRLLEWDFHFIDTQQRTEHLRKLRAKAVPRLILLEMLDVALKHESITGKW